MSKDEMQQKAATKPWPINCPWPEPTDYGMDYDEDSIPGTNDHEIAYLEEIEEYFDSLVDSGRLNEDYTLNEDYESPSQEDEETDEDFAPEKGEEYWRDDFFDIETWREDLSKRINLLQLPPMDLYKDPVVAMRSAFSYQFTNENLLRQAFTRRSFQIEYGLDGCSEELEFLGDTILSTFVTKEVLKQFSTIDAEVYEAPFQSKFNEGELTKIRQKFTSKEALAARARELGLGKFILYGTGEQETDSSLEDMMEALIGAVTIDCNWDMREIEKMVNELICIHLDSTITFLNKSYYDILNTWHQKHFGCIPKYDVYNSSEHFYQCTVRFSTPANDVVKERGRGETRSVAREYAALEAYEYLIKNGLWKNLSEAKIVPDLENSINQLQELFQKGYLDEKPVYEYDDRGYMWTVSCQVESYRDTGNAKSKIAAKKKAAYAVLVRMLISAGLCKDEWKKQMYDNMMER